MSLRRSFFRHARNTIAGVSHSQSRLLLPSSSCPPTPVFSALRRCSTSSSPVPEWPQICVDEPSSWRLLPPPGEAFAEEVEVGSNIIRFETGKLARFAAGAILIGIKDTKVLSTVVSEQSGQMQDFLPLTVDYKEKQYAQGRIPNTFMRREGAPKERELLCGRVIDRSIRPLFPKGFYDDVQVTSLVLSSDGQQDPDVMAATATSAALTVSDIPWNGPIGIVRVGRIDGQLIVNPDMDELSLSDLNLLYTCTRDKTIMIEMQAREVSNKDLVTAMRYAHNEAAKLIEPQLRLAAQVQNKKKQYKLSPVPEKVLEKVENVAGRYIEEVFADSTYGKFERGKALSKIGDDVKKFLQGEGDEESLRHLSKAVDTVRKKIVRERIFEKQARVDGRALDEVRPIFCEAGTFPALHGSSIFSRGNTQVMCTVTLGAPSEAQRMVSVVGPPTKRFMVHYSFPPFSINEVGKHGGLNRREVGHGTLAEKALLALLPPEHDFPYSVRLNSEVMASDGSTSMATVCGGSLALMDAGIALREHVAGISMGLVTKVDSVTGEVTDYRILTDILGLEDHLGDMDFKIAGTKRGVTSIQLDIKPAGIPLDILCECLEPALKARKKILNHMEEIISCPREKAKENAPKIVTLKLNSEGLARLIGPNGSHLRKLEEETGSRITVNYDGTVTILAKDQSALDETLEKVESLAGREMEVGGIYKGVIVNIKDFGAFVEFSGGQQGLLHISELSHEPVTRVTDVVSLGQQLSLMCIEKDLRGNSRFSLKATLPEPSRQCKKVTLEKEDPSAIDASVNEMNITKESATEDDSLSESLDSGLDEASETNFWEKKEMSESGIEQDNEIDSMLSSESIIIQSAQDVTDKGKSASNQKKKQQNSKKREAGKKVQDSVKDFNSARTLEVKSGEIHDRENSQNTQKFRNHENKQGDREPSRKQKKHLDSTKKRSKGNVYDREDSKHIPSTKQGQFEKQKSFVIRKIEVKSGDQNREPVSQKRGSKRDTVYTSKTESGKVASDGLSIKVGDNCTAYVHQIRAYGLVLQLKNGIKGMMRFEKAGTKDEFKVGEELEVKCLQISSKGIPVFSTARKR